MRHWIIGPPDRAHVEEHVARFDPEERDDFRVITAADQLLGVRFVTGRDSVMVCTDGNHELRVATLRLVATTGVEITNCGLPVHGLKMREPGRPEGSAAVRVRLDYDEISNADLANRFTYHPPSAVQIPVFEQIRAEGHGLAQFIKDNTPPSPEQYRAIEAVETAVMLANAALARHGSDS